MRKNEIQLMKYLEDKYRKSIKNKVNKNNRSAKLRLRTAKKNGNKIGRKKKYNLNSLKISAALDDFDKRYQYEYRGIPITQYTKIISTTYHIPVSTLYRLNRERKQIKMNKK